MLTKEREAEIRTLLKNVRNNPDRSLYLFAAEDLLAALNAERQTVAKLELRLAYLKQCDCPSCDKCIAVMCGEADDMLLGHIPPTTR